MKERRVTTLLASIIVLVLMPLSLAAACGQAEEPAVTIATATTSPTELPEPTAFPIEPESTNLPPPLESEGQTAVEHFNRAADYGDQGQWVLAIEELTQAIALDPQFAEAYYMRGSAYEWTAEHEKAVADLTQAVTLDPQLAEAYFVRGLAYEWTEGYEKAIADFSQAITLDPQFTDAYHYRGQAYVSTEEFEKGIADLTQAITLEPGYADAWYVRGMAYMHSGEHEEAIYDFSQAVGLNPQFAEAYFMRAIAYGIYYGPEAGVTEQEQVFADLMRAGELDPASTEVMLSTLLLRMEVADPEGYAEAYATFEASQAAP